MKKIMMSCILVFMLLFVSTAYSMTLAWDPYTDPLATDLKIYSSLDGSDPWSLLVDTIPTNLESSQLPNHTSDNERVYYRMTAFDSVNTVESDPSNSVSFYWTTGGGGQEGPAGVGTIRLLDCTTYDGTVDNGSVEWDLCDTRHNK